MGRRRVGTLDLALAAVCCLSVWSWGPGYPSGAPEIVLAEEASLSVEGLSPDPKTFRAQVDQIVKKVDNLIDRLKGKQETKVVVLDLIQTRDNVLREIGKVESFPEGSKWTKEEARASVEAMLRLLKTQYEKAVGLGS